MHDGCSGPGNDGKAMVNKLRMMGFRDMPLPVPVDIRCECDNTFKMERFESRCPHCGMVYGVTPCSAHDPTAIQAAGIDY